MTDISRNGNLSGASTIGARRSSVSYVGAYPIDFRSSDSVAQEYPGFNYNENFSSSSYGRSLSRQSMSSRKSIGSLGFSKSYGRTECQEYTLDFRMYPNNSYNSIAYSFTGNSIENGNEAAFFQNTICCGVFISNLHELLQHHEEFHDEDAMEFALVDEDNEWDEDDDLIMVMELDEDEAQDNIKVDGSEAALDDGTMSGALAMMLPAMGKSSPTSPVTLPCNDKVKDFRRRNSAKQAHNFTDQSKRSSVSHAIPVQLTLPRSHNGKG